MTYRYHGVGVLVKFPMVVKLFLKVEIFSPIHNWRQHIIVKIRIYGGNFFVSNPKWLERNILKIKGSD
jgi:hypothetical protein